MFGLNMPVIAARAGEAPATRPDGASSSAQDTTSHIVLDEITISARIADRNSSPLRLTDITQDKILTSAAGKTFPELIHNVPGVYATAETGSFGDAKINIRGFKQENISVLLNGVPISGLTSGSMYWNNWMGMADAASSIQVQKGIGNSMLSDNSVGGTIDIITTQPSKDAHASASYYHTGYGTNGMSISVDSGVRKGWAVSLMGSHNWGSSYADMTNLSTWSYQLAVTKRWNERHSLNLTALGSPEKHEQRSQRLTYDEVEKYGRNYSKNWGWYTDENGKRTARTLSRNNYFKPYFTLTHSYHTDDIRVSTTAYLALANGGGYYTESKGKRIASFIGEDGQIDWDAAVALNKANGGAAVNIMSDYQAGHTQAGLKSSVTKDLSDRLQIEGGIHYQLYSTWEREQITDLLGADYWYEDYSKSLAGQAGRESIKHVGDFVRTDSGRDQHYGTIYAMGTWKSAADILTLGVSASGTVLRKWDAYNYVGDDVRSRWTGRPGASIKTGWLHKFNPATSLYANAAVYSRAPYSNVFFSSGSNEVAKDITNEKNYLAEAGFRRSGQRYSFELTAYYAYWQDKTLMSASYKTVDIDPYKYMVKGLDAQHFGIEAEASYRPATWINLDAFASLGQWKWKNDVDATIYDPDTMMEMGQVKVYADGLHVGDAPQTQLGAAATARFLKGFSAKVEYSWNDRIWADFDPVTRTDPQDRADSYRIPSYSLLGASISWSGRIFGSAVTIYCNGGNLLDAFYIERSKDGAKHDRDTFTGYWGNGRNVSFGLRLTL